MLYRKFSWLYRKFSWLYRCANWRCRDFFEVENIKYIKSFRAKKIGFNISGNYSGGCKAMYRTLLEGVWLSDIGRMAEVRNVPQLARKVWVRSLYPLPRPMEQRECTAPCCKVWVRSSYSFFVCLERDMCLSYTLHTLTFSMRTNPVLTPCMQGAVHFFPAQFAIKNPPE